MIGTNIGVKAGMGMFKGLRRTGISKALKPPTPAMHKTTYYHPNLGNVEYLTPQGKRFAWA
jgi:hypothetical protein